MSYMRTELPGEKLIKCLYYVTSSVRIHQDNNQLIKDGISNLMSAVGELSKNGDVAIQVWRGRFHIQGEKLVYRRDTYNIINEMLEYLSARELGGLSFLPSSVNAPHESIVAFIRLLNECPKHEDPAGWLDMQLERNGLSWVEVYRKPDESKEAAKRGEEDGAGMGREEKAQLTYFHALDLVTAAGRSGTVGGIRKARRLAQNIVDLAMGGTTLLLGLATTKDLEDHVHVHSVNVAFIATCLGRRLGLSRVLLEHLALSALYHDLGRSERVKEEFFKQGGKAVESWDRTKRHSLVGIREIVRLNAPAPVRSRILPGVFEHHLNCDLTGHPKTHFVKSLTLYGKILRIADVYEVLTSERGSSPQALTPDEALRHMWSDRGKRFDPLLMKLFVAMMGIYPIGSIVELSTGERGIVMDYLSESDLTQPYVLLLEDDGRGGLAPGKKIDLASPDAFVDGRARVVKRTLHFSELGIQPSEYFQKGLDLG